MCCTYTSVYAGLGRVNNSIYSKTTYNQLIRLSLNDQKEEMGTIRQFTDRPTTSALIPYHNSVQREHSGMVVGDAKLA
jgi:hypothetical protein